MPVIDLHIFNVICLKLQLWLTYVCANVCYSCQSKQILFFCEWGVNYVCLFKHKVNMEGKQSVSKMPTC